MPGCCNRPSTCDSCSKRRSRLAEATPARMTFRATSRVGLSCSARKTVPMPPSPRTRTTLYRPMRCPKRLPTSSDTVLVRSHADCDGRDGSSPVTTPSGPAGFSDSSIAPSFYTIVLPPVCGIPIISRCSVGRTAATPPFTRHRPVGAGARPQVQPEVPRASALHGLFSPSIASAPLTGHLDDRFEPSATRAIAPRSGGVRS